MISRNHLVGVVLALGLLLPACGSDISDQGRGVEPVRGLGKADGSDSCKGYCGKKAPAGCWCDEACVKYGDCCKDKAQECDNTQPSCKGYCGKKNPAGCWCDEACDKYGDCCKDKKQVCDATKSECEEKGGYCGHFLDTCKKGYVKSQPMGCPMGKSGMCCLPDTGGCSKNEDCESDEYCHFKEGDCLLPTFNIIQGTCKARPQFCYEVYAPVCGCDGKTYGNDCKAYASGVSIGKKGECKDPCWGAWLDQYGNCRTPSDGVYPDSCCAAQKKAKCYQIDSKYAAEVEKAKKCYPWAYYPQCTKQVAESLIPCSSVCLTYVNTTPNAQTYIDEWKQIKCDTVLWICKAYMCPKPQGSSCDYSSGSGYSCVDK